MTWFHTNEKKQQLHDKWVTNQTSFKTENYDKFSSMPRPGKPKQVAPGTLTDGVNLVSNQQWGTSFPEKEMEAARAQLAKDGAEERPNPMRARIVDKYIKSVLEPKLSSTGFADQKMHRVWIEVVEQIYRLNLDNRILNNLRQQLNEMIEDERGLVQIETFRKMFFTFFKGERYAYQVYDMLLPVISVYYDPATDEILEESDQRATPNRKIIRI